MWRAEAGKKSGGWGKRCNTSRVPPSFMYFQHFSSLANSSRHRKHNKERDSLSARGFQLGIGLDVAGPVGSPLILSSMPAKPRRAATSIQIPHYHDSKPSIDKANNHKINLFLMATEENQPTKSADPAEEQKWPGSVRKGKLWCDCEVARQARCLTTKKGPNKGKKCIHPHFLLIFTN